MDEVISDDVMDWARDLAAIDELLGVSPSTPRAAGSAIIFSFKSKKRISDLSSLGQSGRNETWPVTAD